MDKFFGALPQEPIFQTFSKTHIISLTIIALIITILMNLPNDFFDFKQRRFISKFIATVLLIQQVSLLSWYIFSGGFSFGESLPLYICRLMAITSAFMLYFESYDLFEIVYFMALPGAVLALLTPDTGGFNFPHMMFFQFFIGHGFLVISIFYMIKVYGFKPTFSSFKKAIFWTMAYLVFTWCFNQLTGGNYSYLRHKPTTGTLMDLLGPYPFYLFELYFIYVFFYMLMIIPFTNFKKFFNMKLADKS